MSFKEFSPKGYSHLSIKDPSSGSKTSVKIESIQNMFEIAESKTLIMYREGKGERFVIAHYSLDDIASIFTQGD
jgi:hypothetical protein